MSTIVCKRRLVSLFALFFFSMPALSANGHIYAATSLGWSYAKLSNSSPQISYASGDLITDAYPLKSYNKASASAFSINGGYEFSGLNWQPAIALGLGVYTNPADYGYNGQLVETAAGDPASALYNYSYDVNSTRLMAEIQFTWILGKLSPFINLGIGPAWTKLSGYSEKTATSTGYPALSPFQAHTTVNFAYQAGLGVSTSFNFAGSQASFPHERLSLGYRFVNLGTTSFGTRGSEYPYHLNTGWLKTNDVYLSYTHLF
jgi:hypothetical protein